jgi:hypothetical protein
MDTCHFCGRVADIATSASGVPSRLPASSGAPDRSDVHYWSREGFSWLARRRWVSHLVRFGLVLRIWAACADCVLPSSALPLIGRNVLRGLGEGRPAALRSVGYQPGGRRLAGRPSFLICACLRGAGTSAPAPLASSPSGSCCRDGEAPPPSLDGASSRLAGHKLPDAAARRSPSPLLIHCDITCRYPPSGKHVIDKTATCQVAIGLQTRGFSSLQSSPEDTSASRSCTVAR